MNRKKLSLIIVCAVAMLALLPSCKKTKVDGKMIVVAISANPVTLDPRAAADAEGDKISSLVCDGLFIKDEKLEIVPNLAESFERVTDVSYRFRIRPGILFSDGSSLTAEDVVYTFKSIRDGDIASPYRNQTERISEIVAESQDTVRIDLKEPYAPFLMMLTRGIVSKARALEKGAAFGRAPVCAGPYTVVKFKPDIMVELAANPNYYGSAPKNSGILFQVIKDDNIRVLKTIKGDVDLVQNAIPPRLIEEAMKSGKLKKVEDTGIVVSYMGFNLTDRNLSDKKVRQAIARAIDRDEIIDHRYLGLAVKANSIIAPGNWAYDDGLKEYPYDPEKAKKLLDEAGLRDPDGDGPRMRFNVVYKTSTVKERVDTARMISNQLAKVGIGMRVEPYEWGTFFRDVRRGNFQAYTLSWVGVTDPDILYEVNHSSQMPPDGLNRDRYINPRVDKLVEEGRLVLDEKKRRSIYSEVQAILLEDLPYLPLWYEKNVVIYRKGLEGISVRPDASYRTLINVEKK